MGFLSNASHVSIRSLTSCRPKQDLPVQDPYILQQIKIILMVREKVTCVYCVNVMICK